MKKKTMYRISVAFILIILATNYIPYMRLLLGFTVLPNLDDFNYATKQGTFRDFESTLFKVRDLESVERRFEYYKNQHPASGDTVLYRTFKKNPFAFWYWHDYLFNRRYQYPYLDA